MQVREGGGEAWSAGITHAELSFSTDDTDLRGAHREVQDAASWGEQPDREQPAWAEVGSAEPAEPSGPWSQRRLESCIFLTQDEGCLVGVCGLSKECVLRFSQAPEQA